MRLEVLTFDFSIAVVEVIFIFQFFQEHSKARRVILRSIVHHRLLLMVLIVNLLSLVFF